MLEDICRLVEFDHEGALPRHDVVVGADPRENAIHGGETTTGGRDKAAHLSHHHSKACLCREGSGVCKGLKRMYCKGS